MRAALLVALVALPSTCAPAKKVEPARAERPSLQLVRFDPAALARLGVTTAEAGSAVDGARLTLPGTLDYDLDRYAEVGPLVEGRVSAVAVRVGDRVKAGAKLVTLQVPSVAAAQADYLAAEAAAQVARRNAEREATLLEQELTTAREAELARGEAKRAEASLGAAAARIKVLGAPAPSSGASIAPTGALVLTSPIDGVVVRRDAVIGRFLAPDDTAVVVADPRKLWANIDVFESDLPYFGAGARVELSVDAMPGRVFPSEVVTLEPQVGRASRAARARIVVDNADGALRPGLFVRASVAVARASGEGRLLVPAAAVQPIGDGDVVFVERAPGEYEVRRVGVTRRTAQVSEIGEGLARGERIATSGAFLLRGEVTKR